MSGGFRSRSKSGDQPNSEKRGSQQRGGNRGRGGSPSGAGQRGSGQRGRGRGTNHQRRSGSFPAAARSAGVDLARAVVFDVLRRVDADGAFANLTLPKALSENKVSGRDAAFATELTYGTLRTEGVLDAVIADCASRGLDAMAPEVLTALRLGTYQVLYTRVEAHAAVDTTVRLVEASGHDKAKGFANGIMRTITRTSAHEWLERLSPQGDMAALAFRHAHPEWIARSFEQALGSDAATELEAALDSDSQRPIVHLVARPGEISAEELALITDCEEGR